MSTPTVNTNLDLRVAGEINTQKALAQGEIDRLRAEIAHPDTQPGWLPSLADDLAGQLAYASQLSYIKAQLAATVRDGQDPRLALLAQLRWLANEASYLTDNGKRESREQIRMRSAAIRAISDAVYYALYDDLREGK